MKTLLNYKIVQESPVFKIAVKVNGNIYYGTGESKTKARKGVTEEVLNSLQNNFTQQEMLLKKSHPNAAEFKVNLAIGDKQITGVGKNRELAKKAAEIKALTLLKSVLKKNFPEICRKYVFVKFFLIFLPFFCKMIILRT